MLNVLMDRVRAGEFLLVEECSGCKHKRGFFYIAEGGLIYDHGCECNGRFDLFQVDEIELNKYASLIA